MEHYLIGSRVHQRVDEDRFTVQDGIGNRKVILSIDKGSLQQLHRSRSYCLGGIML